MTAADAELDRLVAGVVRHMGARAIAAGPEATAELVRLVLRHWPHRGLAEFSRLSRHHAGIARSGGLCRAQVREVWEARHGIDAWDPLLAAIAGVAWECLLAVWQADVAQRTAFREYSRRIVAGS